MNDSFFGNTFDFDRDGILSSAERAMDYAAFTSMIASESDSRASAIDTLESMGVNVDDMSLTDVNSILDDFGLR